MPPPPDFPQLSRFPSLKQKEDTLDPTLRDNYENGMESTRARYLRRRRQYSVSIDFLTNEDKEILDHFVEKIAVYGANIFILHDTKRNPKKPLQLFCRFSTLPSFTDAGWIQGCGYDEGEYRQNCTFQVREV